MEKHKEDILGRLDSFRKYTGKTLNAFAKKIGMRQSTLHYYFHHKRGLSLDPIINTLYAFPGLSPDWLLLGNGEMLRENMQTTVLDTIQELQDIINTTGVKLYSLKTRLTKQQ